MKYICECGKEFDNIQAFKGHLSHCKIHAKLNNKKYRNSAFILTEESIKKARAHRKLNFINKKQQKLNQWISEKHICEHCGKIMTEKFGSGRFCSRACANARKHSDETKTKIKTTLLQKYDTGEIIPVDNKADERRQRAISLYNLNPNRCEVCGSILDYDHRHKKTCSKECHYKKLSEFTKENVKKYGGNLNSINKHYFHGYYNNIYCDSSYELAFVVYCIEHNINIKRNTQGFKYLYLEQEHNYYPDFIVENKYIEIKGYYTKQVQAKIDYFPKNLNYKILYKADMKKYLNYCETKYGKKFWEVLYE